MRKVAPTHRVHCILINEHRRAERIARPKVRFCGLGTSARLHSSHYNLGDFGLLEAKRVSSNRQNRKLMSISVESGAIKKHNEGARIALTPLFEPRPLEPTRIQARALFSWVPTSAESTGMHDGLMTEGIRGHISSFRSSTVSNCRVPAAALLTGAGYRRPATGSID